jgi:endonuclease/exonuclease/phosphatase family metal-dependent hydrolase
MTLRLLWKIVAILFWINALLLTIAVLSPYINPARFWIPAFIGLFFKALFLAALIFFFIYLVSRHLKYTILALVFIIISLPAVFRHLAMHALHKSQAIDQLRIISYNIEGLSYCSIYERDAAAKIVKHIVSQNPDVVCLQELSFAGHCQQMVKKLQQEVGLKFFYTDFNYSYKTTREGSGNGQIVLSRYPLFHFRMVVEAKATSNGAFYVEMKYGKDTLAIINTHLQSIGLTRQELTGGGALTDSEMKKYESGVRKIRKAFETRGLQVDKVKAAADSTPYPLIICGDFNDTPLSYSYKTIADSMQDAFLETGFGLGSTYAGALPFLRIDYILARPAFKVNNFRVLHWRESDHYAIESDISLTRK